MDAGSAANVGDEMVANSIDDNTVAKTAKLLCFSALSQQDRVAALLKPLAREPAPSPLLSMAVLEAVAAVGVEPGSRTTDTALLNAVLEASIRQLNHLRVAMLENIPVCACSCDNAQISCMISYICTHMLLCLSLQGCAGLGRPLFTLFSHPAGRVADGTAVVMRAIAECGAAAAAPMREAALREGAVLHHLYLALFAPGKPELSCELQKGWCILCQLFTRATCAAQSVSCKDVVSCNISAWWGQFDLGFISLRVNMLSC